LTESIQDIRLFQQLVEQRRLLVEDKRRFVNRITVTGLTALKKFKTMQVLHR